VRQLLSSFPSLSLHATTPLLVYFTVHGLYKGILILNHTVLNRMSGCYSLDGNTHTWRGIGKFWRSWLCRAR